MSKKQFICVRCGYQGKAKKVVQGSFLVELFLWLLFLLPGIIYSVWRATSKKTICPSCKGESLIPADSPRGAQIAYEAAQQAHKRPDPYAEWEKEQAQL